MTPKAIRNDIVSRLTGNTSVGSNVSSSPITPNFLANLPAIAVYTTKRRAENINHTSPTFKVTTSVEVDVIVGVHNTFADDVDDIFEEVKALLYGSLSWVNQFQYVSDYEEEVILNKEGETMFATGVLTFDVQSFVDMNAS